MLILIMGWYPHGRILKNPISNLKNLHELLTDIQTFFGFQVLNFLKLYFFYVFKSNSKKIINVLQSLEQLRNRNINKDKTVLQMDEVLEDENFSKFSN